MTVRPIPYDELVCIPERTRGAFSIVKNREPAGYECLLAFSRQMLLGNQPAGRVRFKQPTTWHSLVEEERGVWMTDAPIEQEQHWRALEGARGRVLVGGLGLGVAVNILASLDAVDEIVVVERSREVVDLVWDATTNGCAKIVCADLHEWLGSKDAAKQEPFQLAFYDIWQSDSERTYWEHVVPLRRATERLRLAESVHCWNEDVMLGQLKMSLINRALAFTGQLDFEGDNASVRARLLAKSNLIWTEWSRPFFEQAVAWRVDRDSTAILAGVDTFIALTSRLDRDSLWVMGAEEVWG